MYKNLEEKRQSNKRFYIILSSMIKKAFKRIEINAGKKDSASVFPILVSCVLKLFGCFNCCEPRKLSINFDLNNNT